MTDRFDPYAGQERMDTTHRIEVGFWWPGEGYGCTTAFHTMEQARVFAAKESKDAASTNGNACIRIIETTTTITTVPYPAGTMKPAPAEKSHRRRKS